MGVFLSRIFSLTAGKNPLGNVTGLSRNAFPLGHNKKTVRPEAVEISLILDYILSLKTLGLALSSLRVHLAAISTSYPPTEGFSIFLHPLTARCLERSPKSLPTIPKYYALMGSESGTHKIPFEPLATCSMSLLSRKAAFLLAITSAKRVDELRAIMADPPFMVFHKDKVSLRI